MFSRAQILAFLLLLCNTANVHAQKVPSSHMNKRRARQQSTNLSPSSPLRRLQNNGKTKNVNKDANKEVDKDDDDDDDDEDKNSGGKKQDDTNPPTRRPTPEPTAQPTPQQTPRPSPRQTPEPTPNPTQPPSRSPTLPPSTPPVSTTQTTEDLWTTPGQAFVSSNNNQIVLTMDELENIQYFGGGQITLRFSLWFQDDRSASQAGSGKTLAAVLDSLQTLMCESESNMNDEGDPLGLSTLDWSIANNEEDRELCAVPVELGGLSVRSSTGQKVQGTVLLRPPTTFVVDRNSVEGNLHWTTWRVTWDVLRLGTFYILQGLENAGEKGKLMEEEEIYRAGIGALEGILELALEVSIREQTYEKALVGSMADEESSAGLVLASVYGEEERTFIPKLEFLGMSEEGSSGETVVEPTTVTSVNDQNKETPQINSATSDQGGDDDDGRYDMVYGITEPLDPPLWHPLRVVGIFMFVLTTASLVALCVLSKKRQARRKKERNMAKEGLLNDPESVENMLTASASRDDDSPTAAPSKSYSYESKDDQKDSGTPEPNRID